MLNGAPTWGSEVELRTRASMFVQTAAQTKNAQWDAATQAWTAGVPVVDTNPPKAKVATFAVPAVPSGFDGGQWAPLVAPLDAPSATAPPKKAAAALRHPRPTRSRGRRAPAAAPPAADPNKSTFTVTLKTPDGDKTFECPPDVYLLDQTDELDNADDFADLPYACRAGSCSACAGKVLSGTVDNSACSFLNDDQKAAGFTLTCTAKPTSDVVIQTHVEDDLY